METLEALRRRIANTEDMQSVVTTMKTLAAVSIRQYEAAVEALVDYDRAVGMAFQILLRDRHVGAIEKPVDVRRAGAVVFGSDQGMCGQFNDEISDFAAGSMRQGSADIAWRVLTVGLRAESRLLDAGLTVDQTFHVPVSVEDITRLVQELLPRVQAWQEERGVERLMIFYNRRVSAASYQPQRRQLLPIAPDELRRWQEEPWESRSLPIYRMDWRELFSAVVAQYLFVSLYRACAESLASENASRIASMQAAEKNIEERLGELRTQFHQQRQTSITEELLDVVTGFEALEQQQRRTKNS